MKGVSSIQTNRDVNLRPGKEDKDSNIGGLQIELEYS